MGHKDHIATLALALALALAQGCESSGGQSDGSAGGHIGSGGIRPDLSGRWAMFRWADPVAVEIHQAGTDIEGTGCCGGFRSASSDLRCCQALKGQTTGRRAWFGFSFDELTQTHLYATDVFVSADDRMTGTFSQSAWPEGWGADRALGPRPPGCGSGDPGGHGDRAGLYTLALSGDSASGGDFIAQTPYAFNVGGGFVNGELGPYWGSEMSWSAADHTLAIGPVPGTAPGLPIALWLRFDEMTLSSVEVAMASGLHYRFQAAVRQP